MTLRWTRIEKFLRRARLSRQLNVSQDARRQSEVRFRALIENVSDGVMLLSADGKRTFVSASTERMLGYSSAELLGRNFLELIHPDDLAAAQNAFDQFAQTPGGSVTMQLRYRHKDGTWLWIEGVGKNLLGDPDVQAIVVSYHNVTERKQAEETITLQKVLFQQLFANAPIGIAMVDDQDRIQNVNHAFEITFQYRLEEIAGRQINDVIVPVNRREEASQLSSYVLHGTTVQRETVRQRKDGSPVPVEIYGVPILRDGKTVGVYAIYVDITEPTRAEQALRESEDRYRDLVETSPVITILHNLQGQVVSANPAAAQLLGYTTHEITRLNVRDGLAPPVRDQFESYLAAVQKDGTASGLMRVQTRTGETRLLEYTSTLRTEGVATPIVRSMARDVTELKRAERAQAHLTRQMAALYETSLEINSQTDLIQLLPTIVRRAADLLNARMGALYLMQPDNETLKLVVSHNLPGNYVGTTLRLDEGLSGRVAQTGQPVMVDDYKTWEGQVAAYSKESFRRVLGVPLKSGSRMIGVLNITDSEKTGPYQEEEIRLAGLFADQAAIALENARLFAETKRRADEFAALHETTRGLAELHDLQGLLEAIVQRAITLLAGSGGGMYLYDGARGDLQVVAATHASTPVGTRLEMGEGMAGRVAQTRQPLIVDDYRTWPHRSPKYAGTPPTAVIEVPMLFGGELIGVLVVEEDQKTTRKFTEEDARLLSLFATQAASVVHNARLLAETQRRADEFAALYQVTQDLAIQTDLTDLLQTIIARATALLHAPSGAIFLYDAPRGEVELAVAKDYPLPLHLRLKLGEGMAGRVAQARQPLIVDDYRAWEHRSPKAEGVPFRASLDVPMIFGGELIGVLDLSEMGESERKYSEDNARLLSLFAAQAASAVYNARLLQQTQQRAEQLALLYDALLTLNRAIEPRQVIEHLLEIANQSVHSERADFYRYDPTQRLLTFESGSRYEAPLAAALRALKFAEGEARGLMGLVAAERTPLYLPDTHADPRWIPVDPTIRSALWVPVEREQQLFGVLVMTSARRDAFSPADQRLVALFANQVAVALERAHLFQAEQNRRAELSALYDLSRALADTDALDPIFDLVARRAVETLHVTFARLALVEGDMLAVQAARSLRTLSHDLGLGRRGVLTNLPCCQRALDQNEPTLLAAADSAIGANERAFVLLDPAKTLCLVPLRAGGQTFGLLMLGEARRPEREPFTPEKTRLARSIGDQAASAIHRPNLREQTEHRLRQLQALHTIDMTITASLDLNVTLSVLLAQAVAQLNAAAADVLRFNPHTQMLAYLAGHGFRSKAIEHSQVRLGSEYAGRAALERRTVSEPNLRAQRETLLRGFLCTDEDFVSCVCIPLIAKGEIKGVLEIFYRAPFSPGPDWLALGDTLGTQAALAMDNAELFDNLQRSNLELALAHDATIEGWARTLELRDKESAGHTQRATELTLRLARALGVPESQLIHMRRGALLHDVGKMSIPDVLLHKRGALTAEQERIVRDHPYKAYEISRRPSTCAPPSIFRSVITKTGMAAAIRADLPENRFRWRRAFSRLPSRGMRSRSGSPINPPRRQSKHANTFAPWQESCLTRASCGCSCKWWKPPEMKT